MIELLEALSVVIAALSFLVGVSAWKREFVGKRRIELAESVLALFYEAEDAIRAIRSPASFEGEGRTRQRAEGERETESNLLDRAYIAIERYKRREKLFAQLRSMRYRIMAAFGSSASKPFDEIDDVLSDIFVAADMLGTHYWPRQGRAQMTESQFKEHLEEMREHESVFWRVSDEKDIVSPRVGKAVHGMEEITRRATESQSGLFQDLWSWIKSLKKR